MHKRDFDSFRRKDAFLKVRYEIISDDWEINGVYFDKFIVYYTCACILLQFSQPLILQSTFLSLHFII